VSLHLKYIDNREYLGITRAIVLLRGRYLPGVESNYSLYNSLTIALRLVYLSVDPSDSLTRGIYLDTASARPLKVDKEGGG
jgi:hypothetical protein